MKRSLSLKEDDYIPLTSALEVLYCPRNFYLRYVEGVDVKDWKMERGKVEDEQRRKTVYIGERVQRRQMRLVSDKLGISCLIDAIEDDGGKIYPIEFKTGEVSNRLYDRAQLCAEAMVLEDVLGVRINKGYIYYAESHKRIEVNFDYKLRQHVMEAIELAHDILLGNIIPPPLDDERCRGCALVNVCLPDEVTKLKSGYDKVSAYTMPVLWRERILYVDDKWAKIGYKKGRFIVEKGSGEVFEIPCEAVNQMYLVGSVTISNRALSSALRRDIFIAMFSSKGRFEGMFTPERNKNIDLRVAQVLFCRDEGKCLKVARSIVYGKLANMKTLLLRRNRNLRSKRVLQSIKHISALLKALKSKDSFEEILGIEGEGTREYFSAFGDLITVEGFDFERRTRRPPRNRVNAMLSFGYSILTAELVGIAHAVGLDAYIGPYHKSKYGKPALALDILEEFRPIIVDSLVLYMINKGIISLSDFDIQESPQRFVFLNESGRKKFIKQYNSRMNSLVKHSLFGYRVSLRRILETQMRLLGKVFTGELSEYRPYRAR